MQPRDLTFLRYKSQISQLGDRASRNLFTHFKKITEEKFKFLIKFSGRFFKVFF
jgi:hypothetical protein